MWPQENGVKNECVVSKHFILKLFQTCTGCNVARSQFGKEAALLKVNFYNHKKGLVHT